MDVAQIRSAFAEMSDADLREAFGALDRAHEQAVQLKSSMRLPAAFGLICRDLDHGLSFFRRPAAQDPATGVTAEEKALDAALVKFMNTSSRETSRRA